MSRYPRVHVQSAADRIMASMDYRLTRGVPALTRAQVAVVLRALADHTLLEAAREWRYESTERFCPRSLSIGRFLQDTADDLEHERRG